MVLDFKSLRPPPNYPPYPPYHVGPYIEEYFFNYYISNKEKFKTLNKTLIPVFWTNLYIANASNDIIQYYIDNLPSGEYFTVSQFDDGIQQRLPAGTINFVAGGNMPGIPIPLICSPIPSSYKKKLNRDIFCSFVGTFINTERYRCRIKLYDLFEKDADFYFTPRRSWERIISEDRLSEFCNVTQRSIFTLCPRGYGLQSFRLYEAMQLGSIPVFVYDKPFFPFDDIIDWKSFCILIQEKEIPNLKNILLGIDTDTQKKMLDNGERIYNEYFTLSGMSNNILKSLERQINQR